MQDNMLGPSMWQMLPGVAFMIIWSVVMIVVLLAFVRGMRALAQIAATLERIDGRLAARLDDHRSGAI